MAHSARPSQSPRKKPRISPGVTLAFWRLRQTWRLLLVTGIGIVAAVTFVCTVPFYSDVTTTIGLRDVLASSAQNSEIAVQSTSERLDTATINQATRRLQGIMQGDVGSYLSTSSQFSLETQPFDLPGLPCPAGSNPSQVVCDQLQLISTPTDQAIHHLTLAQGRLPRPRNDGIEIALTTESAAHLKVHLGSILTITLAFSYLPPSYLHQPSQRVVRKIALYVVGIFLSLPANDPFWHGTTYLSSSAQGQKLPWFFYTGLTSSDAYLSYISQLAAQTKLPDPNLEQTVNLNWYYNFDVSHIASYNLDDIETGLYNVQTDIGNDALFNRVPFVEQTKTATPISVLDLFKSNTTVVQVPIAILTILVLGLVLFFVSMMANLLVESQAQVIAILRSRGASRRQLFSSFVTQCVGLGLVAIALGPALAVLVVYGITPLFLASADEDIRTIIANEPAQVITRLGLYALIAAAVTVATMAIAIGRSLSLDILSLRREIARPVHRTLRERLNLDGIAALIAVLGYLFSVYLTKTSVLAIMNAQLNISLLSPLEVAQVIFLFIAGILLFLRLFPALLHLATRFTTRRRSAVPMLAMMQMSRVPQQAVRLTLLLMLATIFTIFSTMFIATQSQRIADVAAYQVGADFSGTPTETSNDPNDLPALTNAYKHVPGVISATLGYKTTFSDVIGNNVDVLAVDADTFAHTAIWNEQDSAQPLSSLMSNLVAQRDSAAASAVIPVYVDAAAWQTFDLSNGPDFTLNVDNNNNTLNFVAIGEVQHIPTINDTANTTDTSSDNVLGGMVLDYSTLAGIYINLLFDNARADNPYLSFAKFEKNTTLLPFNYAWLRTSDNTAAVASVRRTLNGQGKCCVQFSSILDRRAMIVELQSDPLYLDFIGVLAIGAMITMVLALIGNLVASWLSTRGRLTNFVVLRALGATSQQVASILTWEQCMTYVTSIIPGTIGGILFSMLVLPYLIYTGVTSAANSDVSSAQYYLAQSVPPVQIIIPASLGLILASLLAICIVALAMMVFIASRPSMNQTLRLNED